MEEERQFYGHELIAQERIEHYSKHFRTLKNDVVNNSNYQLPNAVIGLLRKESECPENWDINIWNKMISKPYKERLIIAGSLIAAEIDRLNYITRKKDE